MPFYKWTDFEADLITPEYSTGRGPTIKGEKTEISLMTYPAGTSAKPHAHPNEQFQIVLKGKARYRIGKEDKVLGPGEVALMPSDVEHEIEVLEDLELINVKDIVPGWSVKDASWET